MKTKPKVIRISESRLQINKQPINNISLPNYVYKHTATESGKGGTLPYTDQNLKYKVRGDLNMIQCFPALFHPSSLCLRGLETL